MTRSPQIQHGITSFTHDSPHKIRKYSYRYQDPEVALWGRACYKPRRKQLCWTCDRCRKSQCHTRQPPALKQYNKCWSHLWEFPVVSLHLCLPVHNWKSALKKGLWSFSHPWHKNLHSETWNGWVPSNNSARTQYLCTWRAYCWFLPAGKGLSGLQGLLLWVWRCCPGWSQLSWLRWSLQSSPDLEKTQSRHQREQPAVFHPGNAILAPRGTWGLEKASSRLPVVVLCSYSQEFIFLLSTVWRASLCPYEVHQRPTGTQANSRDQRRY